MEHVLLITSVSIVNLLAVMSPGPDFIIMVRNTLAYGRPYGIATALGVTCGNLIHIGYCWAGVATIIIESTLLMTVLKWLGAIYLLWLGVKCWGAHHKTEAVDAQNARSSKELSLLQSFINGFLTNILNPKAMLFYFSVYSVALTPQTPLWVHATLAFIFIITILIWFMTVALLFNQDRVRALFLSAEKIIMRLFGVLLVIFSITLIVTQT